MWVYIRSEPQLWTVGFYDPAGKWHTDSDHDDREAAAARVRYLNGGQEAGGQEAGGQEAGGQEAQSRRERIQELQALIRADDAGELREDDEVAGEDEREELRLLLDLEGDE